MERRRAGEEEEEEEAEEAGEEIKGEANLSQMTSKKKKDRESHLINQK